MSSKSLKKNPGKTPSEDDPWVEIYKGYHERIISELVAVGVVD